MGPLSGFRIVDLGQFITGPYAAALMLDMGAEVIKVEQPPKGDPFRGWETEAISPTFLAYNHGKRSIVLDLKSSEEDRQTFFSLIGTADGLVQNFRPGAAARLGIDYQSLQAINPKLVYCEITGFGPDGPYAQRPSYDRVAQGLSGLQSLLIDPENPKLIGPAFADRLTGMTAALGVLSALLERERTGRGQKVEINMLHAIVHFLGDAFTKTLMSGEEFGPHTTSREQQSYVFEADDGKLFMVHLSSPPKFWESLCRALEREDLIEDPRFVRRPDRIQDHDDLQVILAASATGRTRDEWLARLIEFGVPCAPINSPLQVVEDPQVKHLGIFSGAGEELRIKPAVQFSSRAAANAAGAPHLDEQREEILSELRDRAI